MVSSASATTQVKLEFSAGGDWRRARATSHDAVAPGDSSRAPAATRRTLRKPFLIVRPTSVRWSSIVSGSPSAVVRRPVGYQRDPRRSPTAP